MVVAVVVVGARVVVDGCGGGWAADSLLQPARTSAAAPIPTDKARNRPIRLALLERNLLEPHVLSMKKPRPTFRHRLLERPTIPASGPASFGDEF
ncbi:hypothetical protein CH256_14705 [Rhodococcus sp. 05-2254-6]|nr:hypothetical protein CH256_14705 [Rhodococcus sp. 05-2254-6]OZE32878.1 hypothetical protein CH259_20745 [Rhodococcus sp. 05-2254-4]OZE44227.1 hypothetical protein CH261_17910 [Rhodococcus sp. 05-2254-3]OZE56092.1 hypothetical protein CH283_01010 [Rhodococcus sp. 05-2254-2]